MDSNTEEMIAKVVDAIQEDEVVAFASDITRIPSFVGEETPLARWLQKFFEERGYEVEMQEVAPGNFQSIARLKGTGGGQDLMLNGHIDIDPLGIDCVDPWTPKKEGNRLVGWGLANMKGGTAAMIMAAEAVRKSGVQLKGDLIICPVVGETNELGYNPGTQYLLDHGVTADAAIVPEPYGPPDIINTVTCGATILIIHTKGSVVGSTIEQDFGWVPSDGGGPVDAFRKMVKILDALEMMEMTYEPWSKIPEAPGMTCGTIKAGRGRDHDPRGCYFYADFCTAMVSFFFVPGQTPFTILEDVQRTIEKLKEEDPEIDYEIEIPEFWGLPPIDAPTDMPVIEAIKRGYRRVTGKEIREVGAPDAMPSDHTLLYENGIDAVCYGLEGGWTHEPGRHIQYVDIDQLVLATKVIAATAVDFCNGGV
jgi:acetylornithine deacetylase